MKRTITGFTLLEVLVAVAVFAILSTLSYAGLTRMLEGRDRLEAERDRWRTLTMVFAQIEDDLAQAVNRSVRDNYGSPVPAFNGRPIDPRPMGEPSLEFTRGGIFLAKNGVASDMRRVAYRMKQDGVLVRLVWPALDRSGASEPLETPILNNLDNVTIRFHAQGGDWSNVWPVQQGKDPLPDAVELAFDIKGVGRVNRIFMVAQ